MSSMENKIEEKLQVLDDSAEFVSYKELQIPDLILLLIAGIFK